MGWLHCPLVPLPLLRARAALRLPQLPPADVCTSTAMRWCVWMLLCAAVDSFIPKYLFEFFRVVANCYFLLISILQVWPVCVRACDCTTTAGS